MASKLGGTFKCGVFEPQQSGVSWLKISTECIQFTYVPLHLPIGITPYLPLEAIITMSSWLPESHRLQLALTALASGCIAATAVIGLQNAKQWYSIHDLKGSIPDLSSKHDVEKVTKDPNPTAETSSNNPPRSTTSAAPPNPQRPKAKKTNAASPSPAAPA